MSGRRQRYDEEFKKNAVKLSYASQKSVRETARDLGVGEALLYRWRLKYGPDGNKTRYATLEEENRALQLEIAELKMERDMLKKQRPTLRKTKSNLWVHRGSSGVLCRKVDEVPARATQRILRLEEAEGRTSKEGGILCG